MNIFSKETVNSFKNNSNKKQQRKSQLYEQIS